MSVYDVIINDVSPDVAHKLGNDDLKLTQGPGVDYAYIGFNIHFAQIGKASLTGTFGR